MASKFPLLWGVIFCMQLIGYPVNGQSSFGAGLGSENMHLGGDKLRNLVPHITYEYITSGMRNSIYIEATAFKRKLSYNNSYVTGQGQVVPFLESYQYWHILFHAGCKMLINGDVDKKAPLIFVGGGLADCISLNHYSAKGSDAQNPVFADTKETLNSFGLGFLAGVQYYIKPVIISFKGNLDFLTKKIAEYSGDTNIHTDMRITILVPLHSLN